MQNKNPSQNRKNEGFAALISVVLVSAFLLAEVLQNTNITAALFDEANHKQQRLFATQSALKCLDTVMLELTHDYFFKVTSSYGVSYPNSHCSIVSVGETSGGVAGDGRITITVSGNAVAVTGAVVTPKIQATIVAQVLLSPQKISLASQNTYF